MKRRGGPGGWSALSADRRYLKQAGRLVDEPMRQARKAVKRRNERVDSMEVSRSKASQVSLPKLKCLADEAQAVPA